MNPILAQVLVYMFFPITATISGGVAATIRVPGPRIRSATQHFAAGVVFAAVAGELLPDVLHTRAPVPAVLGFALGVAVMLGVRRLTESAEQPGTQSGFPLGLIAAVGVDITLDGLLLGIGFAAGAKEGMLLTVALTLEVLFLGLATAATLVQRASSRSRVIGTTVALAALLGVGALLGGTVLSRLSGLLLEAVLAFGCAALLYLVTEELLVEAHEVPETPLITTVFFGGFLLLTVIEMLV